MIRELVGLIRHSRHSTSKGGSGDTRPACTCGSLKGGYKEPPNSYSESRDMSFAIDPNIPFEKRSDGRCGVQLAHHQKMIGG